MVNRDKSEKARFDTLRSLAFGSITANYAAVGTALDDEAEITLVINNTDADLLLSFDGTNNHCFIPQYTQRVIDWNTNEKQVGNRTTFYIKHNGAAPTSGSIYVEVVK